MGRRAERPPHLPEIESHRLRALIRQQRRRSLGSRLIEGNVDQSGFARYSSERDTLTLSGQGERGSNQGGTTEAVFVLVDEDGRFVCKE